MSPDATAAPDRGPHAAPVAGGVRVIAVYKFTKAVVQTLLALALATMVASGYVARAHELAATLREHLVHHWSITLAELLTSWLTGRRVYWLVAALAGDALVSAVEGWALARGYAWASWLVVGATSLLLPIELVELARRVSVGRGLLLIINLWIVLYLLRRARRESVRR
jgi:uncharacterized membrane protein (DUF2068 family)